MLFRKVGFEESVRGNREKAGTAWKTARSIIA